MQKWKLRGEKKPVSKFLYTDISSIAEQQLKIVYEDYAMIIYSSNIDFINYWKVDQQTFCLASMTVWNAFIR